MGDSDALTTLYRVLAVLLVLIAGALLANHLDVVQALTLQPVVQLVAGVSGFGIGVVASIMGVAGGELLIPAIVLLFGTDIRVAGSLSLAVSLPTMLVAFAHYTRDQSFVVLRQHARFAVAMTTAPWAIRSLQIPTACRTAGSLLRGGCFASSLRAGAGRCAGPVDRDAVARAFRTGRGRERRNRSPGPNALIPLWHGQPLRVRAGTTTMKAARCAR